jgi:hypothetical protein
MNAINLEQFAPKKTVSIPGAGDYEIRLVTAEDIISGKFNELGKQMEGMSGVETLVNFIAEYSEIPREVIMKQGSAMLNALSTIIQGGNPLN